jgi:hypothetical protein
MPLGVGCRPLTVRWTGSRKSSCCQTRAPGASSTETTSLGFAGGLHDEFSNVTSSELGSSSAPHKRQSSAIHAARDDRLPDAKPDTGGL